MRYRIKLYRRRKATGEHTFQVLSPMGSKSYIQWNSQTKYFEHYGKLDYYERVRDSFFVNW